MTNKEWDKKHGVETKIYQAKINGIIELYEELTGDCSIALEQCSIKRTSTSKTTEDEREFITFHLENLGRVNIIEDNDGKPKLIKTKSKKCTKSQIWRRVLEGRGDYDKYMDLMIANQDQIIDLLDSFKD